MNKIQIDMFEVQLGAAILLQFGTDAAVVRVLADAGVKARCYANDHVLKKINPLLANGDRRIDLIIGTHYDEDHLNGLVPIIDDNSIEIGEAWMPPVANDTEQRAFDRAITSRDLLAHQFSGEEHRKVLAAYLRTKRSNIETVLDFEAALNGDGIPVAQRGREVSPSLADEEGNLSFFREQLRDVTEDQADHGVEQEIEPHPVVEQVLTEVRHSAYPYWHYMYDITADGLRKEVKEIRKQAPELAMARALSLAGIRRNLAKDAINAKALYDVVQALGRRSIPIRSEVIDDGVPRTYRWDAGRRRFLLSKRGEQGLTFTLLGPSKSLVRKHRDILPVLYASRVALAFRGEIRSITPSNQLSYIGCFGFSGQRILITGDAGCVDFAVDRKSYFPDLLSELKPLHVIQVAHHGGNNAHFYRVLAAADYPEQEEKSFLLLSHAYHDKTRPSDLFHDFLMTTLGEGDDVKLLFTSEPGKEKVVDYLAAIYPPVGPRGNVGDVRLWYSEGSTWTVEKHAIKVV